MNEHIVLMHGLQAIVYRFLTGLSAQDDDDLPADVLRGDAHDIIGVADEHDLLAALIFTKDLQRMIEHCASVAQFIEDLVVSQFHPAAISCRQHQS